MTATLFVSAFFMLTIGLIGVPALILYLFFRKYGNKIPTKVGMLLWAIIILWLTIFFNVVPKLVPESMKLKGHQETVCEVRTVYH
ncbi:hypothetical protein [Yersinia phage vB_YenM_P778]